TWLTRSSVHWAERMVATSISSGLVKFRATFAPGYAFFRRRMISGARSSRGLFRVSFPPSLVLGLDATGPKDTRPLLAEPPTSGYDQLARCGFVWRTGQALPGARRLPR